MFNKIHNNSLSPVSKFLILKFQQKCQFQPFGIFKKLFASLFLLNADNRLKLNFVTLLCTCAETSAFGSILHEQK